MPRRRLAFLIPRLHFHCVANYIGYEVHEPLEEDMRPQFPFYVFANTLGCLFNMKHDLICLWQFAKSQASMTKTETSKCHGVKIPKTQHAFERERAKTKNDIKANALEREKVTLS